MRANIQPQWRKLAKWYWDTLEGKTVYSSGMSIWDMLANDYGASKSFSFGSLRDDRGMWVVFPDEKSYTAFLLRWA